MPPERFELFKADLIKIRYPNFIGYTFTSSQIEEIKKLSNEIKNNLNVLIDAMQCRLEEVQT
jgi:hypothetical protein